MTNANDDQRPEAPGHDRRAFLQRAGIGAVAVGAWVAPQVLFTDVASAGCTPLYKMLQVDAGSCSAVTPTTVNPSLPGCNPTNWATGRTDVVPFTCSTTAGFFGPRSATIIVNLAGCGPFSATAVQYCPFPSAGSYSCVTGTIVGNTVTFPPISYFCLYVDFRITVKCCT